MTPPQPRDAMEQMRQLEIRQAIAGMSSDRRKKVIADALNGGRDSVIVALLSADPCVMDMSEAEHQMLKHSYRTKKYAPELDRVKAH